MSAEALPQLHEVDRVTIMCLHFLTQEGKFAVGRARETEYQVEVALLGCTHTQNSALCCT